MKPVNESKPIICGANQREAEAQVAYLKQRLEYVDRKLEHSKLCRDAWREWALTRYLNKVASADAKKRLEKLGEIAK